MSARVRNIALAAYVIVAGHFASQTALASGGSASSSGCYNGYNECLVAVEAYCPPTCYVDCIDTTFTCLDQWYGACHWANNDPCGPPTAQ